MFQGIEEGEEYIENLYLTINFLLFRRNIYPLKIYIFTTKKERWIKIDGIYMKTRREGG